MVRYMSYTPYTPVMFDGSGSDGDGEGFVMVRSPVHVPGSDQFNLHLDVTQDDTYSGETLRNIINEKITKESLESLVGRDWKFVKGFRIMEDQSYSYSQTDNEILIFKGDQDELLEKAYEMYMSVSDENKDIHSKNEDLQSVNEDLQSVNEDLQRENKDLQEEIIILNASLLDMRGGCHGQGGLLAFQARPLEVLQMKSASLSSDTEPRVNNIVLKSAGKRGGGSKYKPKKNKSKKPSRKKNKQSKRRRR